MLSVNQVTRLLKQCERVNETIDKDPALLKMTDFQTAWARNTGWIQALRLVLEEDTYPIRNTPFDEYDEREEGE